MTATTEDAQTQLICVGPYCPCAGSETDCDCPAEDGDAECPDCESPLKRIFTESGDDVVPS